MAHAWLSVTATAMVKTATPAVMRSFRGVYFEGPGLSNGERRPRKDQQKQKQMPRLLVTLTLLQVSVFDDKFVVILIGISKLICESPKSKTESEALGL